MTTTATAHKRKSSNSGGNDNSVLGIIIVAAAAAAGYYLYKQSSDTEVVDMGGSGYGLGDSGGLSDLSTYAADETGGGIIPESATVTNAASEAATVPYYDYETTKGIDGVNSNGTYSTEDLGATDKSDMGIGDIFTAEDLAEIKVSATTGAAVLGAGLAGKGISALGSAINRGAAKSAVSYGDMLLGVPESAAKTTTGTAAGNALKIGGKVISRGAGLAGVALLASDISDILFGDFSVSLNKPLYSLLGIGSGSTEEAAGNYYTSGKTIYSQNALNMGIIPTLLGYTNKSLFGTSNTNATFGTITNLNGVKTVNTGLLIDYSTGAQPQTATTTAKTDIAKDTAMTVKETNVRYVDTKNNSYTADLSTGYTVGMANTSTSEMQSYFAKQNPATATAAQKQQAAVYGATIGSSYTAKSESVNSSTGKTYSQTKADYSSGKGVVTGYKNGKAVYQSSKVQTSTVKETYK